MKNELITLLAFDALLLELDENYQGINETELTLINGKILEEYGVKIGDSNEKYSEMQKKMVKDIYDIRSKMISKINKEKGVTVLNSMDITDTESDGEVLLYIYVENIEENRKKLISLGFSHDDVSNALYDYDDNKDVIDLNHFAWDFAEWFDGEEFFTQAPQ